MNTTIPPKSPLKLIGTLFLLTFVAVLACYWLLDSPLAFYAYHCNLRQYRILHYLTLIPEAMVVGLPILFVAVVIRFFGNHRTLWDIVLIRVLISLSLSQALRNPIKFIFGRYWPATWTENNLSLIHNNAYGFHFFQSLSKAYQSFPSTHTATTMAVLATIVLAFPKTKPVAVFGVTAVVVGLLGCYYHFLGDIIAGAFLGWVYAYLSHHLLATDTCSEPHRQDQLFRNIK